MAVEQLVTIINDVCGLNSKWAKTCIYYCMSTHELKNISWMPALQLLATPGSGKTQLLKVLARLAYQPYPITCYDRMTSVTLRNELEKARDRTAIIEEVDLYPNRTELERYLINRASKATSALPVTHPGINRYGALGYVTDTLHIPGGTILHDRHGLNDMAAERRVITVNIPHQKGVQFRKPDDKLLQSLSLPTFGLGEIPIEFSAPETTGSALDTWEPLIRIASYLQDDDWLGWVWDEVAEFNDRLADGQQFELEITSFKAVIRGFVDNAGMLMVKPLALKDITKIVQEEYPWVKPKTVSTILRKLGFQHKEFRNIGGSTKLITTVKHLKKIAEDIGCQDDSLDSLI